MSRSKKNATSIKDALTEENKMLKSLNKELSRRIKQLEKDFNIEKSTSVKKDDILLEAEQINNGPKKCPDCTKGNIIENDLGVRMMVSCSINCGYKKIIKNEKKETKIQS
jgi:hypothetical protein